MQRIKSEGRIEDPNQSQTIVIKVGTTSLIRADRGTLNLSTMASLVDQVCDLRKLGFNVVLVTSGAVGAGCQCLNLRDRPTEVPRRQALAAVGQIYLMRHFEDFFASVGLTCGQVLLTRENLTSRSQYVNAKATFHALLEYKAIPIVNENDTLAVQEIKFGDNDTLSAQVAAMLGANWLFLMTDVDALYTGNPSADPSAKRIPEVRDLSSLDVSTSSAPGAPAWGTGGMATKLTAARIATAAGIRMGICRFDKPGAVMRMLQGDANEGTVFHPVPRPARGRKRWLLTAPARGDVMVDAGAARAIRRRSSLFAVGVVGVRGHFDPHDAVRVIDAQTGEELARGLCNYSSDDVTKLAGKRSREYNDAVGFTGPEEILHRANMCIMVRGADDERRMRERAAQRAKEAEADADASLDGRQGSVGQAIAEGTEEDGSDDDSDQGDEASGDERRGARQAAASGAAPRAALALRGAGRPASASRLHASFRRQRSDSLPSRVEVSSPDAADDDIHDSEHDSERSDSALGRRGGSRASAGSRRAGSGSAPAAPAAAVSPQQLHAAAHQQQQLQMQQQMQQLQLQQQHLQMQQQMQRAHASAPRRRQAALPAGSQSQSDAGECSDASDASTGRQAARRARRAARAQAAAAAARAAGGSVSPLGSQAAGGALLSHGNLEAHRASAAGAPHEYWMGDSSSAPSSAAPSPAPSHHGDDDGESSAASGMDTPRAADRHFAARSALLSLPTAGNRTPSGSAAGLGFGAFPPASATPPIEETPTDPAMSHSAVIARLAAIRDREARLVGSGGSGNYQGVLHGAGGSGNYQGALHGSGGSGGPDRFAQLLSPPVAIASAGSTGSAGSGFGANAASASQPIAAEGLGAGAGATNELSVSPVASGWTAALRQAVLAEEAEGGAPGNGAPLTDEDVNEEGWLPK